MITNIINSSNGKVVYENGTARTVKIKPTDTASLVCYNGRNPININRALEENNLLNIVVADNVVDIVPKGDFGITFPRIYDVDGDVVVLTVEVGEGEPYFNLETDIVHYDQSANNSSIQYEISGCEIEQVNCDADWMYGFFDPLGQSILIGCEESTIPYREGNVIISLTDGSEYNIKMVQSDMSECLITPSTNVLSVGSGGQSGRIDFTYSKVGRLSVDADAEWISASIYAEHTLDTYSDDTLNGYVEYVIDPNVSDSGRDAQITISGAAYGNMMVRSANISVTQSAGLVKNVTYDPISATWDMHLEIVTPKSINFTPQSVEIVSKPEWTSYSNLATDGSFSLTINDNTGPSESRTGTIRLCFDGDYYVDIAVSQQGGPDKGTFSVSPTSITVDFNAQSLPAITTSGERVKDIKISSKSSWIDDSLNVSMNDFSENRYGSITYEATDVNYILQKYYATVNIEQYGYESFTVGSEDVHFKCLSGTETVSYRADNTAIQILTPSAEWINATYNYNTITLSVSANSGAARDGYVDILVGYLKSGGSQTFRIGVHQDAYQSVGNMTVNADKTSFDYVGGKINVGISKTGNLSDVTVTKPDWITMDSIGDTSAVFTVDHNYNEQGRSGEIVFECDDRYYGGHIRKTVLISQTGIAMSFSVSDKNITMDAQNGEIAYSSSGLDYIEDTSMGFNGLSLYTQNNHIYYTATQNDGPRRSLTLTLSVHFLDGSVRSYNVTLSQDANGGHIDIPTDELLFSHYEEYKDIGYSIERAEITSATSSADWIDVTYTPSRIRVWVNANYAYTQRSGEVNVNIRDLNYDTNWTVTIPVRQKAISGNITVNGDSEINFSGNEVLLYFSSTSTPEIDIVGADVLSREVVTIGDRTALRYTLADVTDINRYSVKFHFVDVNGDEIVNEVPFVQMPKEPVVTVDDINGYHITEQNPIPEVADYYHYQLSREVHNPQLTYTSSILSMDGGYGIDGRTIDIDGAQIVGGNGVYPITFNVEYTSFTYQTLVNNDLLRYFSFDGEQWVSNRGMSTVFMVDEKNNTNITLYKKTGNMDNTIIECGVDYDFSVASLLPLSDVNSLYYRVLNNPTEEMYSNGKIYKMNNEILIRLNDMVKYSIEQNMFKVAKQSDFTDSGVVKTLETANIDSVRIETSNDGEEWSTLVVKDVKNNWSMTPLDEADCYEGGNCPIQTIVHPSQYMMWMISNRNNKMMVFPNGSPDNVNGFISKFGGRLVDDCKYNYCLYYRNAYGAYDWLLLNGKKVGMQDSSTYSTYLLRNNNQRPEFGKVNFNNDVITMYEVKTDWLSERESSRFWHLATSPEIYLHNLVSGDVVPVIMTTKSQKRKTFASENGKPIQYSITLEDSRTLQRR